MLWIDGEYFQDPLEELATKKALTMFSKTVQLSQLQMELWAMSTSHLLPSKHVGGEVVYIKGTGKSTCEIVKALESIKKHDGFILYDNNNNALKRWDNAKN